MNGIPDMIRSREELYRKREYEIKKNQAAGRLNREGGEPMSDQKQFNLKRFRDAQDYDYQTALAEMKNGQKRSHWIWYVFPQLKGLGRSSTSAYYGIESLEEAREYLRDSVLGARLEEITRVVLELPTNNATQVFGRPDDWKFRSCMTLFEAADPQNTIFAQALEKFYHGERDRRTLNMLKAAERFRN